jgi:predicted enzyme related to lactoylglutathione lyase
VKKEAVVPTAAKRKRHSAGKMLATRAAYDNPQEDIMLQRLAFVTVLVRDHDEALRFYTEAMGLQKRMDVPLGNMRWLTVGVPEQQFEVVLFKAQGPEQEALVGKQAAGGVLGIFTTDDIQQDYRQMASRGVKFTSEITEQIYGHEAMFEDLYGNVYDLVEPRM